MADDEIAAAGRALAGRMAATSEDGLFGHLTRTTVRIVSWNLWWRFGPWEARQPAITATLRALDADIVCLQEVFVTPERDRGAELAAELGGDDGPWNHAYATRLDDDGTKFGNAVLSRWPISSSEALALPAPADGEEFRTCLRADVEGPRGPIQAYSTHLNWRFDHSAIRQDQVRAICGFVAGAPSRSFPPVLCGDLNAAPDSDEVRMLTGRAAVPNPPLVFHDAWEVAGHGGPGFTFSTANPFAATDLEPSRRIDYVLVGWPKAEGRGHVVACDLVGTSPIEGIWPSDHFGVVADLRY